MSQNSIIAFALIVGFVVFVTVKGELPKYFAVLGIAGAATSSQSPANLPGSPLLGSLGSVLGSGF